MPFALPLEYFEANLLVLNDVTSNQVEDTILVNFNNTVLADSEHFFAIGHLPAGQLLSLVQNLSDNALIGLSERHVTVYQEWYEPEPLAGEVFCWSAFTLSPTDQFGFPSIHKQQIKATILRHHSCDLLGSSKDSEFIRSQILCSQIRDFYAGSNMSLGKPVELADISSDLIDYMPGYCITGRTVESDDHLLEWPVADFDIALQYVEKWKTAGAVDVTLNNYGFSLESGRLTKPLVKKIRSRIKKYGAGMMLPDLLDDQFD